MKQIPLLEQQMEDGEQEPPVVLEAETVETLVALMASALLAVVFGAKEGENDDAG